MAESASKLAGRSRDLVFAGVALVATLVFTQFLIPESTPVAVLFQGAVFGLLNALIAIGLVLVYRSHRIINFAQAAFGIAGGVFAFNLASLNDWPFLVSAVAGLVVAAGLGLVFQLFFVLRFFNAPRLVLTVLTIAIIPAIQQTAGLIDQLPIFPDLEERTLEQIQGQDLTVPFDDFQFALGDVPIPFGFGHLFAIGMVALTFVGLGAFFRYSRIGIAIRAAAENTERASLLGISVAKLSMIVWAIAGLLGGLAVVLQGTIQRQFSQGAIPPELIILPLAAAALARFDDMPLAAFSAVVLTVAREGVRFGFDGQLALFNVALVVVILGGFLLLHRQRRGRSEEAEASAYEGVEEQRPIPKAMLEVPSIGFTRRALIGLGVIALLVFPLAARPAQVNEAGFLILVGIAILSLVVLTGWAGQASLGQFALVAVAAVVGGALTARVGISFWIAIFLVPVFTGAFAVLMGIPVLRIRGLFLAIVTFAFAIATESVLFQEQYFGWLLPGAVERPTLFFLDFEDNRSMFYLNLVAFALSVLLVVVLRRSRAGRVTIAMRENESNLRSFGVNPVRMRLAAFGLSGFLCGVAGLFIAHHQRAVTMADFPAQTSLDVFLFAVIGGVGSIGGAMIGTLYFAITRLVAGNQLASLIIGPVGILVILYVAPGGLASLFTRIRDGVLRIVAQRRQMIVPALYEDVDPEALRRRLIPLAEPLPNAGLDALPYDRRYVTASELYGRRGRGEAEDRTRTDESAAFGAAAERAEEIEDEAVPAASEEGQT